MTTIFFSKVYIHLHLWVNCISFYLPVTIDIENRIKTHLHKGNFYYWLSWTPSIGWKQSWQSASYLWDVLMHSASHLLTFLCLLTWSSRTLSLKLVYFSSALVSVSCLLSLRQAQATCCRLQWSSFVCQVAC